MNLRHILVILCVFLRLALPAQAQQAIYSYDTSGNLSARTASGGAAPQIVGQPRLQIVVPGFTTSFSVALADSTACAYQWRFFGTNLPGQTGDALIIPNVSTNNQGPYMVVITNSFGSVTSVVTQLYIDRNRNGLPDVWELAYFNNLNQTALGDSDGDGISNLQEFYDGTNPTNNTSFRSRLTVLTDGGGTVRIVPAQANYSTNDVVTLNAMPFPLNSFYAWTGDLAAKTNPASLLMNTSKTVRGIFACQPAVSGLVGWWRGEGDASDYIGGHAGTFYTGTSNALPPSITSTGMVGSAMVFYGTNYVRTPDANDLRPAQITVEAWVYTYLQNGNYQTVLAKGSAVNDDDTYYLGLINGSASFWTKNNGGMSQIAGGSVPPNQWVHLAATFDGATKRLYVNGVLVANQGGFGPLTYDPQSIPLAIGSDWVNNGPGYLFSGLLDEVSLFDRALSSQEVMGLFIANAAGKCTAGPVFTSPAQFANATQGQAYTQQVTTVLGTLPVTCLVSAGTLPAGLSFSSAGVLSGIPTTAGSNVFALLATDALGRSTELVCGLQVQGVLPQVPAMIPGLVSWWRAENNALDSAGTNHGTLSNGVSFATGEVGRAFLFSGVTTQQVRITASPSLNVGVGGGLTIEGWIKPANLTNQMPLAEWNDGVTPGSHFWINVTTYSGSGSLFANIRDINSVDHYVASAAGILSTNAWQHVAVTYDNGSGIAQLFLNGNAVATAGLGGFIPRTSTNLFLGYRPGYGAYAGLMDEMSLFNRALTTNEIAALYYAGQLGKLSTAPYLNTSSNLADGVVNAPYLQSISTVSSAGPVTFSLAGGTLPPGISLSLSGLLSGTPTNVGSYYFSLTATDTNNAATTGAFSIQVYAPVPPPAGLVGWWRGESNALDQLGLHNGTLVGNATYGPGKAGTAFKLDGNNSYVDLGPWTAGSNWTMEVWAKPAALPSGRRCIFGAMNNCLDWALALYNGQFAVSTKPPGGCGTVLSSGVTAAQNGWSHVAATCDGYTVMLYVNGVLMGATAVQPNYFGDATGVRLGSDVCCGEYFPGSVDEASLYNRPLTAAEISSLYLAGAAGKTLAGPAFATAPILPTAAVGLGYTQTLALARGMAPVAFALTGGALPAGLSLSSSGQLAGTPANIGNYSFVVTATDATSASGSQTFVLKVLSQPPPPAGIISWWRAEGNTLDSIGGNNGYLINNAGYATGKVGQAFALNGGSDAVEFLDSPSLRPASLTLECWVMFLSSSGIQSIMAKTFGTGTADSFAVWLQNGGLYGGICDVTGASSPLSTPFTPYLGQWYHVAYTFDDTTKQQVLYLNGAAVAFSVINQSIGYDNHPLLLGADVSNSSLSVFLLGRVDEASIYSRALSGAEIAALYNADVIGKPVSGPYFTTPPSLPDAAYNLGYTQTLATVRGTPVVSYALTGGSLPPGLSLGSQGVLSGVATNTTGAPLTNSSTFNFTVMATDGAGLAASQTFSLRVVPPLPPPAGLVSWWRAEGNALDSSGTNDGTALNATLYAPGEVGQAFLFDGFSSCVHVPDSSTLRVASITLEAWVRFDVNTGTQVILAKPVGTGTLDSFCLWIEPGYFKGAISSVSGFSSVLAYPFTATVGQWYHVAYTFDDATRQQVLYLNNLTVASGLSDRYIAYDTNAVYIGCDVDNGSRAWFLSGRVDEASIYSRALPAAEIALLYYAGVAGKTLSGPYFTTPSPLQDAIVNQACSQTLSSTRGSMPVAYSVSGGTLPPGLSLASGGLLSGTPTNAGSFNFTARVTDSAGLLADQPYAIRVYAPVAAPSGMAVWYRGENNAQDSAGTNNGTSFNLAYAVGKVGQAFSFNGTNSFIAVSNSSWLNPTGPFSLEVWVNANPQQFYYPFLLVDKSHGFTDGAGWAMQGNSDGTLSFFFGYGGGPNNFSGVSTLASILDSHWHHLVGVYDGAQVVLYQDAVLQNTRIPPGVPVPNTRDVELGRSWGGGSPTRYFNGLLDEITFYNRGLSAAEVVSLYNAGPAGKTLAAPPIVLSGVLLPAGLVLSFNTTAGKSYTLQSETNLGLSGWLDLYTTVASSTNLTYTNSIGPLPTFFRVKTSGN